MWNGKAVPSGNGVMTSQLLESFQAGLPVHLIGTPRNALMTCEAAEPVAAVVERNRNSNFDFLPVTKQKDGGRPSIIGLFEVAPFMGGEVPRGSVLQSMYNLSELYLVGADSSIIDFIRRADQLSCRLIVSGDEISGLASLYDVQKLPARAALFAMVTSLEMRMTEVIRVEFLEEERWLTFLSEKRRNDLAREIAKAQAADTFVDPLLMTQFGDKATILRKARVPTSKGKLRGDMERIRKLRDSLAHANEYGTTREQARLVCGTVRLIDEWMEILGSMAGRAAPVVRAKRSM
jgi:hypothetical protein